MSNDAGTEAATEGAVGSVSIIARLKVEPLTSIDHPPTNSPPGSSGQGNRAVDRSCSDAPRQALWWVRLSCLLQ
jgi:hypothetical protein